MSSGEPGNAGIYADAFVVMQFVIIGVVALGILTIALLHAARVRAERRAEAAQPIDDTLTPAASA